jgi:hypothetical protein
VRLLELRERRRDILEKSDFLGVWLLGRDVDRWVRKDFIFRNECEGEEDVLRVTRLEMERRIQIPSK